MDWDDAAGTYWEKTWDHDEGLSVLPEVWQRELVALYRLSSDLFNGGYLQFFVNNGREYYLYASQVLKKIGAARCAEIIHTCQTLIDEHSPYEEATHEELNHLLPNPIIDREGNTIKEPGSVLPGSVLARISELSYEFMDFPEEFGLLAEDYFRPFLMSA